MTFVIVAVIPWFLLWHRISFMPSNGFQRHSKYQGYDMQCLRAIFIFKISGRNTYSLKRGALEQDNHTFLWATDNLRKYGGQSRGFGFSFENILD